MPWRPSASAQVRASAICPTAAAACESSSLSGPIGSFSTERPSAIAPDDTTRMSRFSACRRAMSPASEISQSSWTRPPVASTSSEELTLMTMRRKSASAGTCRDMAITDRVSTIRRQACPIVNPAQRCALSAHGLHRHLRLDLRRLARAVLSERYAKEGLAALVCDAVLGDRNQRVVLSYALAGRREGVARADPGRLSLRLEGIEVHHA